MKKKTFYATLVVLLCVCLAIPIKTAAQTTFGAQTAPKSFSVLELISNQKMGMRLPQITETERDAMTSSQFGALATTEAKGLMIFNTTIDCMEYWDGTAWLSRCEEEMQCVALCDCDGDGYVNCTNCDNSTTGLSCDLSDSDPCDFPVTGIGYTRIPAGNVVVGTPVVVTVTTSGGNPVNTLSANGGTTIVNGNQITVIPKRIGANTFTITVNNCSAQTIDVPITTTACTKIETATVSSCLPYMFTYQTMTLTATSTGGAAVSYQWYINGEAATNETSSTFNFNPRNIILGTDALGNRVTDVAIACEAVNACGRVMSPGYNIRLIAAQSGMLSPIAVNRIDETGAAMDAFRVAHVNLGAEYVFNPCDMSGDYYQWGRRADGHQNAVLAATDVWPNGFASNGGDATIANEGNGDTESSSLYPPLAYGQYIGTGQVLFGKNMYGKFIKNNSAATYNDWRTPQRDDLWAWYGALTDYNRGKTSNDPCPDGWKIPSQKQWQSILKATGTGLPATANTWEWISGAGSNGGYKIGNILFLPAAGQRAAATATLENVTTGYYWSSVPVNTNYSAALYFTATEVNTSYSAGGRASGRSVRCVESLYDSNQSF